MSDEQKINQILNSVLGIEVAQEQIMQKLDAIDRRLTGIEIKMSKVEKWVALENADFAPKAGRE